MTRRSSPGASRVAPRRRGVPPRRSSRRPRRSSSCSGVRDLRPRRRELDRERAADRGGGRAGRSRSSRRAPDARHALGRGTARERRPRAAAEGRALPRPGSEAARGDVTMSRSDGALGDECGERAGGRAGSRCSRLSSTRCVRRAPTRRRDRRRERGRGPELRGDRGEDEIRVAQRGERHEDGRPVGLVGEDARQLDREACLADTAGPDDREDPRRLLDPERHGAMEVGLAADERRRGIRQVDRPGSPQRRERGRSQLVDPRRPVEVLEMVTTEIGERHPVEERRRRLGDEHLHPVRERCDARAAVDVHAHVSLARHGRRARCAAPSVPGSAQSRGLAGRHRPRRPRRARSGTRRRTRRPGCRPRRRRGPRTQRAACAGAPRAPRRRRPDRPRGADASTPRCR